MRRKRALARLTCVLGDADLGGVPRVYIDLLSELQRRGRACRIVSPDGAMRAQVESAGIQWQPVDWAAPRSQTCRELGGLLVPGELTLSTADPRTVHVLPALAAHGPTLTAVHTTAPRLEDWFEPGRLGRLRELLRALYELGRTRLLTIAPAYAAEHAGSLELPHDAVAVLPPAVDTASIAFAARDARLERVLSLCRLSPEKASHVLAAVELVATRLEDGHDCRLDVVGDGPWRERAAEVCAARLPAGAYELHGPTGTPLAHIAEADAVVATGIGALEAAAAGARVVAVRTTIDDAGPLGCVLTPASFDALAATSFSARDHPPTPAREIWAQLEGVRREDLAAVRTAIERSHSVAAAADTVERELRVLGTLDPEPTARIIAQAAAELEDRLEATQRLADEIWVARQQLEQELERLRAARRSAAPNA